MVRRLARLPAAEFLRDALVAISPGLCQLITGWAILG